MTRRKEARKASTLATDRGRVERHIVPLLGHRTVKDLTAADLRGSLRDVIAGKTRIDVRTANLLGRSIVTGGKGTATRTMALLSSILTYGVGEDYRADNPARGIVLPGYTRRKVRLDEEQYRTLDRALCLAEENGASWQTILSIRLIALTGCRRGEIMGLQRSEVHLQSQMLSLIDTKTGASVRPIGAAAVAVLHVFRSRRADRIKLVFWDGTGFCLFAKRLEEGAFQWPSVGEAAMRLSAAQLATLLEGLDWRRLPPPNVVRVPSVAA